MFCQVIAIIIGILFVDQDYNKEGIMNVNGALFMMIVDQSFSNMLFVMNVSYHILYIYMFPRGGRKMTNVCKLILKRYRYFVRKSEYSCGNTSMECIELIYII